MQLEISTPKSHVLFEPWSLGDVMIAAAVLRPRPKKYAIACHPRWHSLLQLVFEPSGGVELLAMELNYTSREKPPQDWSLLPRYESVREVLNIRGDFRDFRAARRVFPKARVRVTGWYRFGARRIWPLDLPFQLGFAQVKNRYRSWSEVLGLEWSELEESYRKVQQEVNQAGPILIHVGAQWRSRQFPAVKELRESLLQQMGSDVRIIAGPSDPLPPQIEESDVVRPQGAELIALLRSASQVVTNDSGPMHLAAFLGSPVMAIARTSNIQEWIPPLARFVASTHMAKGYRPDASYSSDQRLEHWPEVSEIVNRLKCSPVG